jgi:hypothetical protein
MDFEKIFDALLVEAEKLRPGFQSSLGDGDLTLVARVDHRLPNVIKAIYDKIYGTKHDPEQQVFFDFIPGFRLVDILGLVGGVNKYMQASSDGGYKYCMFENYSNDFVVFEYDADNNSTGVFKLRNDDDQELICDTDIVFFEMILSLYKEKAYFVDSDGFLDYDFDKEGMIGKKFNPSVEYWNN